ncbi:MAG: SDR family oxidoreductase [Pirellulales bacterium]|nr:SDR family oxidoreductase [Pirellulales bacterium]
MPDWRDKVVVVTGGSAGLGQAIAKAFAERGARVVITARGAAALETAVAELCAAGHTVWGQPADVTREADMQALVAETLARWGRLDVLVNNAGRSARGKVLDTTPADFDNLWRVNLLGVVHGVRAAAPHLAQTSGHIVNIGSLAAKAAARYLGAYPATKFALAAYTQQLRLELGEQGIHAMLVCPGPIARHDARQTGADKLADLPASAARPGGGVKTKAIDPDWLAARIVRGCERHEPEIVVPAKARLLFTLAAVSARWGDWLVRRMT